MQLVRGLARVDRLMDRSAFIGGLALGILVMPRAAPAQAPRKIYRVGIVGNTSATADMVGPQPRSPGVNALLLGLRELGYVYGEHFVTEPRGAEGEPERFPKLAAELVRLQVDVIVAAGGMLYALKEMASTIPVVMTGIAAPVAVLWHRTNLPGWQAAEATARERGWKLISLEIRKVGEIEGAFKAATAARSGALLVFGSGLLDGHARRIAELASKSRLPAMYSFRSNVEVGGLISYGVNTIENLRRAAVFVDKILKGAKAGDVPIEQ